MEPRKKTPKEQKKRSNPPGDSHQEVPRLEFKRSESFESLYANNVRYEASVWDLKLLFGVLDQQATSPAVELVELNTAMSMPWPVVKIMAYYLQLNVAIYELENGKIRVNPRVYPTEPPPVAPGFENNELVKAGRALSVRMREEFIKQQQAL